MPPSETTGTMVHLTPQEARRLGNSIATLERTYRAASEDTTRVVEDRNHCLAQAEQWHRLGHFLRDPAAATFDVIKHVRKDADA